MQNRKEISIKKYKNLRDDIINQKKVTLQQEIQQQLNFIDQELYKTPYQKDDSLDIQQIINQISNLESLNRKLDKCMDILQKNDKLINSKKKIKNNKEILISDNREEFEDTITPMFNNFDFIKQDQNFKNITINQQNFQPIPIKHHDIIEEVKQFLLPQPFQKAHIYSLCLLNNEKNVGLCLGESHPFVIFDLQQSQIIQTIPVIKQGVYEAIMINKEEDIVIGCSKSIHILKNIDNQYKLSEQEFNPARDCPSRLIQQNDRVFSTNIMTQLGEGGSCIQMWDLKSGNGSIFKMKFEKPDKTLALDKTSGALALDGNYLLAGNKQKQILIWSQEQNESPQKFLQSEEDVTSLRLVSQGTVVGGGKKKLFIWKWKCDQGAVILLDYGSDNLNTKFIVEIFQYLTVGDDQGSIQYYLITYYIQIDIVMINQKNPNEKVTLFEMRSKVMMIQIGNTIGISGCYDGSFFSFRIKNK